VKPLRGISLKRFFQKHPRPDRELVLMLQDVEDPVNVGASFRTADALRCSQVVLTGISARPPHKLITKVGRGKDRRVRWRYAEDSAAAVDELRAEGFEVLALEITEDAIRVDARSYSARVCLVVGHEDHGVTRRTLERCDGSVFLPMYGKGASMNLSVALGIAAYTVLHAGKVSDAPP